MTDESFIRRENGCAEHLANRHDPEHDRHLPMDHLVLAHNALSEAVQNTGDRP